MKAFIVFVTLFGVALSSPPRSDIDRNIFSDTWDSITDGFNSAMTAAETAKDVTELIFRCKDVAMDLVHSLNVGEIKGKLQPILKDGFQPDDITTIGHLMKGYTDKMSRFGDCMAQEGEFKPQDDWWNPFGRGLYRKVKKPQASDRSLQLPHAFSLSVTGSAALTVGVGATGSVEIGGAFDTSGNVIAYSGHCLGGDLSDEFASIDGSIVVGFWNELGSIPGHSHTIGTSFGAEEGFKVDFGVDVVWNDKDGYIGTTITVLSAGLGVDDFGIPIEITGSRLECDGQCLANLPSNEEKKTCEELNA